MLVRFRRWLSENKIFFDTLAAVTLSGMALVVSYGSYRQTSLQTKIQAAQAAPILIVKSEQIQNPDTRFYEEHRVTISNLGSPVRTFASSVRSAAIIEVTDHAGNREPNIVLPLSGYFAADFETGDGKGVLATYTGNKNNLKAEELRRCTVNSGWFVNIV